MSKYRKMRMIDLYSSLGYERKSSKRKLEDLDAATASFFREYTNQGNRISLSIINIEAARLCALNFLHEDERGEKYWPVTSEEIFQWAKDQDREEITDILTYIFRKKAFSDYVSERKDIRDREAEAGRSRLQKPKSIRKRPRNRKHDDDDSLSATDEGPTQNEKACIPSDLELSTIKFWKDPPEQPSAKYCGTYLQGLNPQLDLEPGLEFRRKWISSRSPKWPISADNRLLRFMFENDLFIAYDHGDEIPAAFLRSLREGTEIEEMSMSEVVKFRNLATGRVRELTHQLTQKPCLILEYRRDGVIRMTERFERFWKKKEVYWEDSPKLTKKHKKSKAVRAKTPLVFPSPREQSNATAELPSAQADTGSRFQLASIAETALNMSTGREELNESRAEQSFFADLMDIDSEPEFNIPTSSSSPRRSLSPVESIVIRNLRVGETQAPDNMPALVHSQENQVPDKRDSRCPTLENTPCTNGSGRPTLLLKVPMPISPITASLDENMTETAAVIATNENAQVEKPQQNIDESFSSIHDLCTANWSGAVPNQSASPVELAASRNFGGSDAASTSIWSSQNHQQITSVESNDIATASPPRWQAECGWLGPQTSTTSRPTPSMDNSWTLEKFQHASSMSGDYRHISTYMSPGVKDGGLNCATYQNSAPSTQGSRRSSPFEISGGSDNPSIPNMESARAVSGLTQPLILQVSKPTEEPINEISVAGLQPSFGIPSSPNAMNLYNLLGGHESLGDYASASDREHTPTSTSPLSSWASPFSAHYQTSEIPQSPTQRGMVKRKGFRPFDEISRTRPSDIANPEPHSNHSSAIKESDNTCTGRLTNVTTPESISKTFISALQSSVSNSSPEGPAPAKSSPQSSETSEKPVAIAEAINQPNPQGGSEGFGPLVSSHSREPVSKPSEGEKFALQGFSEGQSSLRMLNPSQDDEMSSSALAKGINLSNLHKPVNVNNFMNEIDGLNQIEDNPSEPTLLGPRTAFNQPTESQTPVTQEASIKGQKSQTWQTLRHDLTPPGVLLPATTFSPVHPNRQSFGMQSEPQVPPKTSTRDLAPAPEKRIAVPVQEPLTPPAQDTPHRRNGSYSFVPPPEAFTLHKSASTPPPDTRVPQPPIQSTDRRLTTLSTASGASSMPTLTLLIESADGSMSLERTHPFEIVKNSSLSEFFLFYSSVSGTPLSTLTSLEFQPAFGKRQSIEIRRYGGEEKWKRLKEVITNLFDRAVRKDTGGRAEWQVLISSE